MSGWQSDEHIFAIYDSEQGFDVQQCLLRLSISGKRSLSTEVKFLWNIDTNKITVENRQISWTFEYFANKFYPW